MQFAAHTPTTTDGNVPASIGWIAAGSSLLAYAAARRWLANGVWRTTLVNQACVVARRFGVSPKRLAGWRGRRGEETSGSACSADGHSSGTTRRPISRPSVYTSLCAKTEIHQVQDRPSEEAAIKRIADTAIQWSK